ncbi:CYTH domain-containing protein [Oceanobacillus sp. CAU 1775]
MAQEIEIEFKNLLTVSEFNHLLTELNFPKTADKQTNFYFETEDFRLKEKHSALRIREKNNKYTLTLKEPYETGLLETHDALTKQEATQWIEGTPVVKPHTSKQLEKLQIPVEDFKYFGSLETERREIKFQNVLLVLDYSKYNQQDDYELELEADDFTTGKRVFEALLSEYQIPVRDTPNKIARFFQSFK